MNAALPHRRIALVLLAVFALVGAFDWSDLDLALAYRISPPFAEFPLRQDWILVKVFHDGARMLIAIGLALLAFAVWKPFGALRRLTREDRVWLLMVTIGGMVLISSIKRFTATSCPWDLTDFGGHARYVSHWVLGVVDGGGGHCFPAGHAAGAFAWMAGWFALRPAAPTAARRWLATAIGFGLALGIAQQLRGAHYMSHTLWTAWICAAWAWAMTPWLSHGRLGTAHPAPDQRGDAARQGANKSSAGS